MKLDIDSAGYEEVRIEILPLIDVIFCILTFFILAAVGLTRQQAISLDLPTADTGTPLPAQGLNAEDFERLYVSIDGNGQIYIDQQPVSLNLLSDVLVQHQEVSPQGLIVLYAARDARYANVVEVLDLLRSVGGDRVALATLPAGLDQLQPEPQPGLETLDDLINNGVLNNPLEGDTPQAPLEPLPPDFNAPSQVPTTPLPTEPFPETPSTGEGESAP
ncbi:MAG: biopolymer transporter ExbD [Leptolyngbyaceae cyanobacterium SM1_1_3]|nr:biopolymer transporter ExbD [Leptolyngbyaceae cyanobacterium SM1_1_3]NJN01711.1 biopolymer transporter ExbD [Leptolyngbyaceae cyanobacterium RM1_1_2]NJO09372.1 biopolymer transporter ExbD [Leptolyngbyaceae cyanobacterium SL_1_1]